MGKHAWIQRNKTRHFCAVICQQREDLGKTSRDNFENNLKFNFTTKIGTKPNGKKRATY